MPAKDSYAAIGMDSRAGQPNPSPHPNSDREAAATDLLDAWVERGDIVLLARAEPHESEELTVEQLLGRAILRLRLYFGWSQRELSRRARLHQSTISRVERGKQAGLSLKRLFAICRALRVVDVDLVTRKPSVPPTELELMLRGDRWARAVVAADRKVLGAGANSPGMARHGTLTPGDR
jgi:transcriptional regulator with XRE-family HTH domain